MSSKVLTDLVQLENVADTKKETEAQGGKVTCSRSYNLSVSDPSDI